MKTFLIIALVGIGSLSLYAQQPAPRTSYSTNLDFFVGTWRYENPQTGEEFTLRLRKTSYHLMPTHIINATDYVVGAYTFKRNGQIVTDCMDKFNSDRSALAMPVSATNATFSPCRVNPNRLGMRVRDYGKRAPNGSVKTSGDGSELLIVSATEPHQIRWILREERGPIFLFDGEGEDGIHPDGFSIPTDIILTRVPPSIIGQDTICGTVAFHLSNPAFNANWSISSGFEIISEPVGVNHVTVVPTNLSGEQGTLTAMVGGVSVKKSIQACNVSIVAVPSPGIDENNALCAVGSFSLSDPSFKANWSVSSGFEIISSSTEVNSVRVVAHTTNGQWGTLTAAVNGISITKPIQACLSAIEGPSVICPGGLYFDVVGTTWWIVEPYDAFKYLSLPGGGSLLIAVADPTVEYATITAVGSGNTKVVVVCSNPSIYIDGDDFLCVAGRTYQIVGLDNNQIMSMMGFVTRNGTLTDDFQISLGWDNSFTVEPSTSNAFNGEPITVFILIHLEDGDVVVAKTIETCRDFIVGPSTLCGAEIYRVNVPFGANWTVTSGFEIVSRSTDTNSVTVVPTNFSGQTGILTAIVNGVPTRKTIRACNILSIVGSDTVCATGTFALSNPNQLADWSVTGNFFDITSPSANVNSVTVSLTRLNGQTGTLTAMVNGSPITKTIQACRVSIVGPSSICDTGEFSLSDPNLRADWSASQVVITSQSRNTNSVTVRAPNTNGVSGSLTARVDRAVITSTISVCNISSPDGICWVDFYSAPTTWLGEVVEWSMYPPESFEVINLWNLTMIASVDPLVQWGTLTLATSSGSLNITRDISVCYSYPVRVSYIEGPETICLDGGIFRVQGSQSPILYAFITKDGDISEDEFLIQPVGWSGDEVRVIPLGSPILDGKPRRLHLLMSFGWGWYEYLISKTFYTSSHNSRSSTDNDLSYIVFPNPASSSVHVLSIDGSNFVSLENLENLVNRQVPTQAQKAEISAKYEALMSDPEASRRIQKLTGLGLTLIYPNPAAWTLFDRLILENMPHALPPPNTKSRYL
ncbi:MAG: hypothetical protein FWD02_00790 [Bacteroidales bacterium]|nr:hypothetical protein [Bacteroidales bacterium]